MNNIIGRQCWKLNFDKTCYSGCSFRSPRKMYSPNGRVINDLNSPDAFHIHR